MREISQQERIAGGLYGLLIGDALGVPYEFYEAEELPAYEQIEMAPPFGFRKTYPKVAAGTWSDDGAQALCLMDSLIKRGEFSLKAYADSLLAWYEEGFWAVDGVVFDVGIQTANALTAYKRGGALEECGLVNPEGKGNGALMRVLPLALWHSVRGVSEPERRNRELVRDAHSQCLITHGHPCNQVCSALYSLVALELLKGADVREAIQEGVRTLRRIYREGGINILADSRKSSVVCDGAESGLTEHFGECEQPKHECEQTEYEQEPSVYEQELEWSIRPDLPWEGGGTGYVVDCLRSAFMILEQASGYEDAVKRAVLLGHDTDTTACVTGGLAGIRYGLQGIPKRWLQALREKEKVDVLLAKLWGRE